MSVIKAVVGGTVKDNLVRGGKSVNIAVFGDIMLDEYHSLSSCSSRPSPEFPGKLVYDSTKPIKALGGAANTAANIRTLGANVTLYGVIGDIDRDPASVQVLTATKQAGIRTSFTSCNNATIPVKSRIYLDGEYLFRKDEESNPPNTYNREDEHLNSFYWDSRRIDVIVVSDYYKGVCGLTYISNLLEVANKFGIPVIVDTKPHALDNYKGGDISLLAINEKEALEIVGVSESEPFTANWFMQVRRGLGDIDVVVTAGSKGIFGLRRDEVIHVEAYPGGRGDSVGCGDSVKAMLAVAKGLGAELEEALEYAAAAGAVASDYIATHTVSAAQVLHKMGLPNDK